MVYLHVKKKMKLNPIVNAVLFALLGILVYIGVEYLTPVTVEEDPVLAEYKKRDVKRDSLLYIKDKKAFELQDSVRLLIIERDNYKARLDGTLVVIERLTRPVVTDEVIDESLEWIKQYNESLSSLGSLDL